MSTNCSATKCPEPKRQRAPGTTDQPAMCLRHDREYEHLRKQSASTLALTLVNMTSAFENLKP